MYRFAFLIGVLISIFRTSWAQVNLPTGKAEFNFPLYDYNDGNRLSTSVSLNYKGGGGIKVDELASKVGLGWELEYGGIVSRLVAGEPDDQIGQDLDGFDAIGDGYYKHNYPTSCPIRTSWVPLFSAPARYFKHDAETIADREQDIFTFRCGTNQGSFVIGKDGSILSLQNTNLKFEKVEEDMSASQIVTRISKFIITTEEGIQYVFNDKTLNRIISYEPAGPVQFSLNPPIANRSYFLGRSNVKMNNVFSVDNWLLSEIVNPLTGKKIVFNYEAYTLDYVAGEEAIQSVEKVDDVNFKEVIQWIQKRVNGTAKRISTIQLPNNTSVEFTYYDNNRVDMAGEKALKQVAIKEGDQETSGYVFTYQYFSKNNTRAFNYAFPTDEIPNARLSLLSIQRKGLNNSLDKPYTFSYYIGDKSGTSGWVPPRMAPSKDHWGFYNAMATYPYDNNLNIYKNLANLFAPRYRVVFASMRTAENGCLKAVKYPTGGMLNFEYELNTAWVDNTVKNAGGVRVRKITQTDAIDDSKVINTEYKYVDEAGHPSSWGYEEPVYADQTTTKIVLPANSNQNVAYMVYGEYRNMVAEGFSSYVQNSLPIALFAAVITYMVNDIFSPEPKVEQKTNDVSFSSHWKKANPLPFLYKRVEVYSGTQTDNIGKIVYEYTSNEDFPLTAPEYKLPYSAALRGFGDAYGLPKRSRVFNKSNELVKEVYNKYNVRVTETTDGRFHSVKCTPFLTLVCTVADFSNNSNLAGISSEDYYPLVGRVELEYTSEKIYSDNDYMLQRTDYTYDPVFFHMKKLSTTNSLGEKVEKRMYYPYDYNVTGPLAELKNNNILDVPVSTETWLIKPSGEELLVDAEVSDYQQIANGDYKPAKIYTLNSSIPVNKTVIGEFDPTKLNRNDAYLKVENTYSYNDDGEVEQALNGTRIESSIYDDNSENTIAVVKNAPTSNIAYSSFEENALGNWQIPVAGVSMITDDATAPTGKRCLKLTATATLTKSSLDAAKEYYVTYWYKGGAVTVSGATIVKDVTAQTINGWTLKILRIKQATNVSIGGTAYLDEVRLYPVDAKMVTTCYNQLMKVSAITAADNTTVYYEYDDLGRLKITRDSQRNIVGLHEYKDIQ